MIPAFLEGVAQSLLPCSWIIVVPAVLVGLSGARLAILGAFTGSVVVFIWTLVSGLVVPSLWVAGLTLVAGAALWWIRGFGVLAAIAIGAGVSWAWRPCVGTELGQAINTAQQDPLSAFPGLAAFTLGLLVVGLTIGALLRLIVRRFGVWSPRGFGPIGIGLIGLAIVLGVYSSAASLLARWSTSLWS